MLAAGLLAPGAFALAPRAGADAVAATRPACPTRVCKRMEPAEGALNAEASPEAPAAGLAFADGRTLPMRRRGPAILKPLPKESAR
ncbi:hypothetical protein LNKW23_37410 [Paralimibaculum aggregatum]|uniref:Uncharacterized protein n=1 Tax=Paralimibaculum aggregatum TaxID=3036245 RepID=A0ABQ6LMV3_9RHOB|nr:hypothetical protein LNKW23_37410 [Limibaculum sp. NKW23]